ncbi:MAG: FecR domain-containing protein [Cyanobacteria bacterium P01_A01_bin.114]
MLNPKVPLIWLTAVGICCLATQADARDLSVRVNRWLEFRALTGSVQYINSGRTQTARVGARLNAVGDGVRTGRRSTARLAVDTEVGFVTVAENSYVRIARLRATRNGGRVTDLDIIRGQARLQVRPFTNRESELNIRTPAGVSGVRGTEFGVAVKPDGETGVATLEGRVVSSAQGVSVDVPAGFQTLIEPGEPPQPPEPLRDDPTLDIRVLRPSTLDGSGTLEIAGSTDKVNLLIINEEVQSTDENGSFELRVLLPGNRQIQATVITPLGTEQVYELVVP